MKEYLHAIVAAFWLVTLIGTAIGTWEVHSWKDGSDQTHAYQVAQQQTTTQLNILQKDMQDSVAASTALSNQLGNVQTTANRLQESFRHDNAAKLVSATCPNPFTPDFVRDLNSDPSAIGAQSAAPSPVHD